MDKNPMCCKRVYGGGRSFTGGRCSKVGKVQVGLNWYCSIHSPEGEAKRKARQDKFDAEKDREWQEKKKELRYAADAVRRCKELGIIDPLTEIGKVQL